MHACDSHKFKFLHAIWVYMFQEHVHKVKLHRPKKQVIKTFSKQEGWWYIGINGDGGLRSKGTRLLIEKEKMK